MNDKFFALHFCITKPSPELKNIVFEIPFAFCCVFHPTFEVLQPYESFARSYAISWKTTDKVSGHPRLSEALSHCCRCSAAMDGWAPGPLLSGLPAGPGGLTWFFWDLQSGLVWRLSHKYVCMHIYIYIYTNVNIDLWKRVYIYIKHVKIWMHDDARDMRINALHESIFSKPNKKISHIFTWYQIMSY